MLYAAIAAPTTPDGGPGGCIGRWRFRVASRTSSASIRRRTAGSTGSPRARPANAIDSAKSPHHDGRPLLRIGGGDLPTIAVDPKNDERRVQLVDVFWRTEDGGATWSAVRGSPGGDDYQKTWINPNNPDIILVVSDQGGVVSANRGVSWSNWYTQPTAAMYHVSTDNAFPYRVCGGQQDAGSACVDSRSNDGEITFHDWHPVNIQEYGIAAPDPEDPDHVFASARTNVSLYNRKTGQTTLVGPDMTPARGAGRFADRGPGVQSERAHDADQLVAARPDDALLRLERRVEDAGSRPPVDAHQPRSRARRIGPCRRAQASTRRGVTAGPQGAITALSPSPLRATVLWAGTDDGNIQVTKDGGATWTNVTPPAHQAVDAHLQYRCRALRCADRLCSGQHDAGRRSQPAFLAHARRRQDLDGDRQRHRAGRGRPTRSARTRG